MSKDAVTFLGFDDRLLRLIGIPVAAGLIPLIFFRDQALGLDTFLHSLLYTIVVWEGSRPIFISVTKRYPAIEETRTRLQWIIILLVIYVAFSCTFVGIATTLLLPEAWQRVNHPSIFSAYAASYVTLTAVGAIYESMHFFYLWKTTLSEKQQIERAHLSSQLEGLRNQVNPHFLFNSLNTLVYLIPEDPDKAVGFVRQLSKVYRYVLESRDAKLIPLRDELSFLEAYIFLLRERFGESLHIDLKGVGATANDAIVPLSLQMLFENAIKHNIISVDKPLTIEVFTAAGGLVVRNNLQLKNQVMDSTGVGLDNIRMRYRLLTNQEVAIQVTESHFAVILPRVSLQAIMPTDESIDYRR